MSNWPLEYHLSRQTLKLAACERQNEYVSCQDNPPNTSSRQTLHNNDDSAGVRQSGAEWGRVGLDQLFDAHIIHSENNARRANTTGSNPCLILHATMPDPLRVSKAATYEGGGYATAGDIDLTTGIDHKPQQHRDRLSIEVKR